MRYHSDILWIYDAFHDLIFESSLVFYFTDRGGFADCGIIWVSIYFFDRCYFSGWKDVWLL